jgi:hypothetical protein
MARGVRSLLAALTCLVLGVGTYPVSAQEAQPVGGSFIVNGVSGRCIGVSPFDLTNLVSLDCEWQDPNTDQRWVLTPDGFISNAVTTLCIDVLGFPGIENGVPIQQSVCEWQDPNTDQRWQMSAEGFIVNLLSGRCIDVSATDGTQLVLWDCEWGVQGGDQGWFLS